MAEKKKLNVKLLRKIERHILEEPRRFMMSRFYAYGQPGQPFVAPYFDLAPTVPECGTAACIAGWANILTGHDRIADSWNAEQLLGLTDEQGQRLFLIGCWPNPFKARYRLAKTPKTRAKIAAERIEFLIKEGK